MLFGNIQELIAVNHQMWTAFVDRQKEVTQRGGTLAELCLGDILVRFVRALFGGVLSLHAIIIQY